MFTVFGSKRNNNVSQTKTQRKVEKKHYFLNFYLIYTIAAKEKSSNENNSFPTQYFTDLFFQLLLDLTIATVFLLHK